MCIENNPLDRRIRWLRALASLALVVGLLLWNFARQAGRPTAAWFDGFVGLLMGFSIAANLLLVAKSRRRNHTV